MKIRSASTTLFIFLLVAFQFAKAESAGAFEILDITSEIHGEPQLGSEGARATWQKACSDWKSETKSLNKNNELIAISCESPTCSIVDTAKTQCTSVGKYKIKTAGTLVKPVNEIVAAPAPIQTPPALQIPVEPPQPQIIYETIPAPRYGFSWVTGYWMWRGHRHIWVPGYWRSVHHGNWRWARRY